MNVTYELDQPGAGVKSQILKPLYNKVTRGLPGLGTPLDVARRINGGAGAREAAADRTIALYTGLGGGSGFVFGLPGFLLLPLTVPANITTVAALQLHMCAAIAALGGHDLESPETRDRCIRCLLEKLNEQGENSEDEEVASRFGVKLAERGVRFAAEQATRAVGWMARRAMLRKIGLGRLPLVGGLLGASSDAVVTRHVGRCAKEAFLAA